MRGVVSPDLLQQLGGRLRAQRLTGIPALGYPQAKLGVADQLGAAPVMLEAGQVVVVVSHAVNRNKLMEAYGRLWSV